ncbi:AGAP008176-PA-like protein [Anopheles sinensis]|uniref:Venom dipeptidyl peptidase 4 n=1 Tax=Anopheles sinensis TaxID=74873 RepID=A0A084W3B1_ANOSI|nr:AGAP008176-PA-like protein [Anopheles sinensis]
MGYRLLLVASCLIGGIVALPVDFKQSDLKDFTFDEIIPNQFGLRGFNGTWLSGSELLYREPSTGNYVKLNVNSGESSVLLSSDALSGFRGASVQMIKPDFTKVLVRYDVRTVFRHSSLSKYAIYDTLTSETYHIANQEEVSICILAPTGQSLAYVKDNNVYYRASLLEATETSLTEDGVPGIIYNGIPDWVYEEEVFGTDATLWFSPDGQRLAMASFDDREVKEFSYHVYGGPDDPDNQYPEELRIRYPKVNTTNPIVHLRVKNLAAGQTNSPWVELPAPVAIVSEDHVLGTVNWVSSSVVGAIWTNRRQNIATFQKCQADDGTCDEEIRFDRPHGWYDLYTPVCYGTGESARCFLMGENNGWRAILELGGTEVQTRTPERFTVSSINGYDQQTGDIFYTAVPASAPHHRHVYRNEECLTCDLRDMDSIACNFASVSFSPDMSYMAATCSGPTPSYTQIFRTSDRQLVLDWEANLERREQLKQYKQVQVRFLRVPVGDGSFMASVRLYLPPEIDFDGGTTTEKYPMIVYVYAGPNSVGVTASFGIGFSNYMATTKRTIYAQIDGRGTGNQGYEFLFSINNRLGTYEMEDQIAVAQYLQKTYSFIDPARTGIWGSSYGGYATAMTLEKDHEQVYRCGISVAPVTSWMFYDSIYTERYMGRPTDNAIGYNQSDISSFTEELKNHLFLLIHGTADDNVHYQQSMVFVRALLDHDVDFEQMTYPDEAHSLSGVQRHLYHTMDQFWDRCFA